MMNSLLTTTAILLALCSSDVNSFSPTKFTTKLQQKQLSVVSLVPHEHLSDISFLLSDAADAIADAASSTAVDTTADIIEGSKTFAPTYSKASYYTTLALYVASFPGLWSQIKRSTKAKVKRKTYVR
jgi:hypothetical protein